MAKSKKRIENLRKNKHLIKLKRKTAIIKKNREK